jgi:hypothetical protein
MLIISNVLFSQEKKINYFIDNIDSDFIGYYVSIDFMASIERYRSYALARNLILENTYYAHIIVNKNDMNFYPFYSDCYFEVSVEEFTEFKFEILEGEMIITDQKGNRYKKMTNSVDYKTYYKTMENYIGNIVLNDFIRNKKIIIEDDYVIIPSLDNKKYGISTWLTYEDDANLAIYDENNRWVYVEINNNELIIYRNESKRKIILWRIKI